jgi:hypothetical protein
MELNHFIIVNWIKLFYLPRKLKEFCPILVIKLKWIGVKQSFSAPDASWFKGESIEYVRRLLFSRQARIYEFLDRAAIQSLVNDTKFG